MSVLDYLDKTVTWNLIIHIDDSLHNSQLKVQSQTVPGEDPATECKHKHLIPRQI